MAVIQKIRNKYAKFAGGFIAFALVGFILMDAMSGTTGQNIIGFFKGGNYAFKVNGNSVDLVQFQTRVSEYEALYQVYGNMRNIDEATRAQIQERVLSEMIYEKAVEKQMKSLGITSSKDEINDIIYGNNPDPLVQQFPYFKDQKTGQFNPQYVQAFEKQVKDKNLLDLWEKVKNYVIRNHNVQKYTALLVNGVYTPEYMTDAMSKDQQQAAVIRFVKVPFNTISDNEIKVTDNDLQEYIKAHAPQFTNYNPNRSIEYVSFDVVPSSEDSAKTLASILQAKTDLEKSTDPASTVGANSEEGYIDAYMTKKMFNSPHGDTIFSLPIGTVYGPYLESGAYKVVKVVDRKMLPDSVKIRHVLIKTQDQGQAVLGDTIAKVKIDSIENAIKSGADFKEMVVKFSDDEGSKQTGGEYEFSLAQRAQISKEFGDFIFEGKAGEKKVVKVENPSYAGYHYIEIINQSGVSATEKLAVITKSINFSESTYQSEYSRASEFAGKSTTAKAFDENIKSNNLNKRIASSIKLGDFSIQGISGSREIIKWVFNAKKAGEISPIFNVDNSHFIVAKITDILDKGLIKVDDNNRPMLEAAVKAEKKAKMIAEKYKSAGSLEAIAQTSGQPVQTDSVKLANSFGPVIGFEPKAIGYAFFQGFQPNALSPAIKGRDGIVYISVVSRETKQDNADPAVKAQQRMMMDMQNKNGVAGMIQEAFKRTANVQYNPDRLY